jgi:solute carrier family 25 carnitine/acylcarnitine transporter 20/29
MESHLYVRKQLVQSNTRDRYDLDARRSAASSIHSTEEYWTNGTTTILSVPSSSPQRTIANLSGFRLPRSPSSQGRLMTTPRESSSLEGQTQTSSSNASPNNVIRNSLLSGSVAGVASTLVCHPFDVLRVKMQSTALSVSTASTGVTGTFRNTIQYGGVRALYTGLALPLAAQAVYKGTVFTVNNLTQQAITEWKTQENYKLGKFTPYEVTMTDRFVCGCMGGTINGALFVTPVEYVRNQLISQQGSSAESQNHRLKGPISVIRRTLQSEGILGLWRGATSTVLRDSVGCGCFFVAMAYAQEKLSPPDQPPSSTAVVASGALAGVAFWLWALPIDTMKTWIQSGVADNLKHALEISQRQGMRQTIPNLIRGWQVAYGRGAPSAAITVTTYSLVHQYLNQQME